MKTIKQLLEKTLTPAEKKKREEIAKAMEKDNPDMPMDKKMAIATATAKRVAESDFEPHMMYDPETGKSEKAEKPEDHERLKKKGYTHEKPEVKEDLKEEMITYKVKGMQKPEMDKFKGASRMGLKVSFKKSGSDTHVTLTGTKKNLRDFDAVARGKSSYGDPSTIKHFDESLDEQHQEALDMLQENYRTLARKGMGTETKKDARVGLELDFYETERGDKVFGKIIKVTGTGYTVQAMERGNSKKYTFKFHDRAKAKKLLEVKDFMENYRAKRDAMRAMGKRGKDPADIDITATDDDRKAASKNVLMQIRKASDLPKGGEIEFEGGKKGKISQTDAQKVSKLFSMLKRPADKEKFQKVISKDLKSIQGLLKRLGR